MAANTLRKAAAGLPRLRVVLRDRHGVELDDPLSVGAMDDPPAVLVVAHFYVGLLALLRDNEPARAADHFAAAAAVAKRQFTIFGVYRDPESPELELQALSYRVSALARCAPEAVPAAIDDLEAAVERIGRDSTGVDRLRALPVPGIAGTWRRRVRFALGRRQRATASLLTHWQRVAQQRRAGRRRAPDAERVRS
jgi:hypothetical protein